MVKPMPAYEVEKLDGKVKREVIVYDKKTKERTVKIVEEPAGYHVYFSRGHSIRVRTDSELHRLGLSRPAPYIDADSGMDDDHPSLKDVERKHLRGRSRQAASIDNPLGDN